MDRQSLPPKLRETLEVLDLVPDRADRIPFLIGIADRFRDVPPRIAARPFAEEVRVPQCESEAYVWAERRDAGGVDLHFAVENPQGISAKALAVILQEGLAGEAPEALVRVPTEVVYEVFGRELSMGKSLGLVGMVQMVQAWGRRLGGGPGA